MSQPERNVALFGQLQAEVQNGGYHQFFSNSSGDCAIQTMAALDEIGLTDFAALHRRALARFPAGRVPEDRAARNTMMQSIANEFEAWSDEDRAFYALGGSESTIARYVRANAQSFSLPARLVRRGP